jgi:hypothetical protein
VRHVSLSRHWKRRRRTTPAAIPQRRLDITTLPSPKGSKLAKTAISLKMREAAALLVYVYPIIPIRVINCEATGLDCR